MLSRLTVRNYALIRELDIEPDDGLTIITGETGAGKSIIVGALSLILGNRADSAALMSKSEKCVVEALFDISDMGLGYLFTDNDLDYDDNTLIRREISPSGRSRAFINDTPVNLALLRDIAVRLVDVHSQHQTLLLHDSDFQTAVVDSYAGNEHAVSHYRELFRSYSEKKVEYETLKAGEERSRADMDYYTFQLKQLEDAGLKEGELSDLERERDMLSNAEAVREALSEVSETLSSGDMSVVNMLATARSSLRKADRFIKEGDDLLSRLESASIEIDDVSGEISTVLTSLEADPQRLGVITERVDHLYALMHKHRCDTEQDLIATRDELRALVENIETGSENLSLLEAALGKDLAQLEEMAGSIAESRAAVTGRISDDMERALRSLAIPNARFSVRLIPEKSLTASGSERAEFLFSANRQTGPEPLAAVASGGELSRVMLALKHLLCSHRSLPTVIFDEVDAGVSGEVANRVGEMMVQMGGHMQVINITHLPQIAAKGRKHYYVYKRDVGDSTITSIKLLSNDERVGEIARLLSGSEVTTAAIENARILIGNG